jgi:hypothetical protein
MITYVNLRPESARQVLSDGSDRTVGPWGLAFLPDSLQVVRAEFAYVRQRPEPVRPARARARQERQAA